MTVIQNIKTAGDYGGFDTPRSGLLSADYVYGRMMKTSCRFKDDILEVSASSPRGDYQSWARRYSTYESLVKATAHDLKVEYTLIGP